MSSTVESIDVDFLISLVQERKILWDKSQENFKNKNFKAKAWEDVTKKIFREYDTYTPDEKNKIGFTKCLAGRIKSYSGPDPARGPVVATYGLDKPEESDMSTNSKNDDIIPGSSRYVPVNRKRRAEQMDDFEKETLKVLKEQDNRHMNFFKGILPSVEDFTDLQTLTFQNKVLQIITKMRYGQIYPQSSLYQQEEPSMHGYQTRSNQSTRPFSAVQSNSNFIPSPNQVSQDSDLTEFDFTRI